MKKPTNVNKIHRHLGEFQVVDYTCYGATSLPEGDLYLFYDKNDKKAFVCQNETVYGSLKLNEQEQKFIFGILSSNMNLLECCRVPSEEKTPLEQKFRVSVWVKDLSDSRPNVQNITINGKKEGVDVQYEFSGDTITDKKSNETYEFAALNSSEKNDEEKKKALMYLLKKQISTSDIKIIFQDDSSGIKCYTINDIVLLFNMLNGIGD